MNLLDLPTDLIERTVRLALPSPLDTSADYRERQSTLLSLCLVNSFFCQVAQPVLQEAVWVLSRSTEQSSSLAELPRSRIRDIAVCQFTDWSDIAPVILDCRPLRSLRLSSVWNVELKVLEGLANLRSLHLVSVFWSTAWSRFTLLSVEDLECRSMRVTFAGSTLLSPSSFPSLRGLTLATFDEPDAVRLDALLPQLSTLVIRPNPRLGDFALPLVAHGCEVLFHLSLVSSSNLVLGMQPRRVAELKYVRFGMREGASAALGDWTAVYLEELASHLRSSTRPVLSLLYLPSVLVASSRQPGRYTAVVDDLVSACVERAVLVDYEDCDQSTHGTLLSPKFEAYVDRCRNEAENAGKEE